LDSLKEPGISVPPNVSDGHSLVSSFGSWDDHSNQNVVPLVSDLAGRFGTETGGNRPGTEVAAVAPALQSYLAELALQEDYTATLVDAPTFEQLFAAVQRADGIALLLGFWEWQGDRWVYLGGHFVTVSGAEPLNRYLAISDPFQDAWEAGEAILGRTPVTHPFPHQADVHNDAQYVSHDAYRVVQTEGPGGVGALENYVPAFAGVPNFTGQNVPIAFDTYFGEYSGSPIITTKVDFAVVVSRKLAPFNLFLPIILKSAAWMTT
jgi:hypothetical protein